MSQYFIQLLEGKIEDLENDLQWLQEDYDALLAAFKTYYIEGRIRFYGENDLDDDEVHEQIMHLVKQCRKK